jgi:hypothetical protein
VTVKTLLVIVVVQALNFVLFIIVHRLLLLRLLLLRRQIGVWRRSIKRPKLKNGDRLFWSQITRISRHWRAELVIVKPETVLRWRRRRFREY